MRAASSPTRTATFISYRMRYAIVETEKAEAKGLKAKHHRTNNTGSKMAVNENELLKVDKNPETAATLLGGKLQDLEQFKVELRKWDE